MRTRIVLPGYVYTGIPFGLCPIPARLLALPLVAEFSECEGLVLLALPVPLVLVRRFH